MGIESGFRFNNEEEVKKTTQDAVEGSSEKSDNIDVAESSEDADKRYKFYYAKKSTKNNPVLSEKEKSDIKNEVLNYRKVTPEFKKEDLKTPEFEKKIDIARERIINFGKKIGLDLDGRMINNEDICLLRENKYKKLAQRNEGGEQTLNEILLKQKFSNMDNDATEYLSHNVQHELLHSACKKGVILKKDNRLLSGILYKKRNFENILGGYQSLYGKLNNFDEFLTEVTNLQIDLDNNEDTFDVAYLEGMIFVTELADDIARKIGKHREEVLTEFQIGMFEGKRGKLKIIKDLYGAEALNKMINMENNKKSILKTSEAFGLPSVAKKIDAMEKGQEFTMNVGTKKMTYKLGQKI